ncbi:Hippocampus abundant transcript-like protein 1, partial [Galemys pyrenaicus]
NKVVKESTILPIPFTSFLSELSGRVFHFSLLLSQVIGFRSGKTAMFIAMVGILSLVTQTVFLSILMRSLGNKNTILGLGFQMFTFAGSVLNLKSRGGITATMSSVTILLVSALLSCWGVLTGTRELCDGLRPADNGFIFHMVYLEHPNWLQN